ncbi:MAG TPA: hypothetical protein VLA97_03265 [Nocardioidaceae bacterium]|nr:hypothetical protein [Nocardioidaceae bacterium]
MRRHTHLPAALVAAVLVLTGAPPALADTVDGDWHDNVLRGTDGPDTVSGRGGDDRLHGRGGRDLLVGGPGDDVLRDVLWVDGARNLADKVRDGLRGGKGDDVIRAGQNDVVRAGPGNDRVYGFAADRGTYLDCGAGKDVLHLFADITYERIRNCETIRVHQDG